MRCYALRLEIWPQSEYHLVLRRSWLFPEPPDPAAEDADATLRLFSGESAEQARQYARGLFGPGLAWTAHPWMHGREGEAMFRAVVYPPIIPGESAASAENGAGSKTPAPPPAVWGIFQQNHSDNTWETPDLHLHQVAAADPGALAARIPDGVALVLVTRDEPVWHTVAKTLQRRVNEGGI